MRCTLALVCLLLGCNASIEDDLDAGADLEGGVRPDAAADARVDTLESRVDVGAVTDTGTSTSCVKALPSSFACEAPDARKGKRTCSEAMIQAFVPACYGSAATSAKCTVVQKKYPGCESCILNDWLDGTRIDIAGCILAISPTSTCAGSMNCGYECLDHTCATCSTAAGSGRSGVSERYDCLNDASRSTGTCWAKGMKDYAACAGTAKFALCFPATTAELVPFFRGACRDGGSWSNALSP